MSREYKIHYRACVGSLFYLLSTRMDLCFAVKNLEKFSSNTGKLHLEGLVNLLRYIRDNKNWGLEYYAKIEYATLYDLLIQDVIKTENQLMVFYEPIWQECTDNGRSTGEFF